MSRSNEENSLSNTNEQATESAPTNYGIHDKIFDTLRPVFLDMLDKLPTLDSNDHTLFQWRKSFNQFFLSIPGLAAAIDTESEVYCLDRVTHIQGHLANVGWTEPREVAEITFQCLDSLLHNSPKQNRELKSPETLSLFKRFKENSLYIDAHAIMNCFLLMNTECQKPTMSVYSLNNILDEYLEGGAYFSKYFLDYMYLYEMFLDKVPDHMPLYMQVLAKEYQEFVKNKPLPQIKNLRVQKHESLCIRKPVLNPESIPANRQKFLEYARQQCVLPQIAQEEAKAANSKRKNSDYGSKPKKYRRKFRGSRIPKI